MTLELLDPLTTGYYARRQLADGRTVYVFPITFGRARLGVGNDYFFDDLW
jgi:hypothetical protein